MDQVGLYLGLAANLAQIVTAAAALMAYLWYRRKNSMAERVIEQQVRTRGGGALTIQIANGLGLDEAEVRATARRNPRLRVSKSAAYSGSPGHWHVAIRPDKTESP